MELQVLFSPFLNSGLLLHDAKIKFIYFIFLPHHDVSLFEILHQGFGSFLSATAPLWGNKINLLNKNDVFVLPSRQKWLSRTSTITVGLRLPPLNVTAGTQKDFYSHPALPPQTRPLGHTHAYARVGTTHTATEWTVGCSEWLVMIIWAGVKTIY